MQSLHGQLSILNYFNLFAERVLVFFKSSRINSQIWGPPSHRNDTSPNKVNFGPNKLILNLGTWCLLPALNAPYIVSSLIVWVIKRKGSFSEESERSNNNAYNNKASLRLQVHSYLVSHAYFLMKDIPMVERIENIYRGLYILVPMSY